MSDLLPCPLCGSIASFEYDELKDDGTGYVRCTNEDCGLRIHEHWENAESKWNTRNQKMLNDEIESIIKITENDVSLEHKTIAVSQFSLEEIPKIFDMQKHQKIAEFVANLANELRKKTEADLAELEIVIRRKEYQNND